MARSSRIKQFRNWAPRLINFAIVIAVSIFLFANISKLNWSQVHVPWLTIIATMPLMLIFHAFSALAFFQLNQSADINLKVSESFVLYSKSLLAAYIPGKVFVIASRKVILLQHGIPITSISMVFFLENALAIAGAIAYIFILSLFSTHNLDANYRIAIYSICAMLLLGLNPISLRMMGKLISHFLPQTVKTISWDFGLASTLIAMLAYLTAWIFLTIGVYLVADATISHFAVGFADMATAMAIAGVAGAIAIISPSGLGVREGILVAILQTQITIEQASLLAVIIRLWMVLGDLFTYCCSFAFPNHDFKDKLNEVED